MTAMLWLGGIKLDALTVRDLPMARSWEYAAHKTIEGLPVLQLTGRDASDYQIVIRIHPALGTPATITKELEAVADAGEVLVLQTGAGEQLGSYVITGLDQQRTWMTPKGELIAADVGIKLKEHRFVDIEFEAGIAIEGIAASTDAQPTQINTARDPGTVPLSEIVRSG